MPETAKLPPEVAAEPLAGPAGAEKAAKVDTDPKAEPEAKAKDTGEHPEPVPVGHVLTQDNVSEPGVQKTHSGVGDFTHHDERHKDKDK